jgi:hypothetical protein
MRNKETSTSKISQARFFQMLLLILRDILCDSCQKCRTGTPTRSGSSRTRSIFAPMPRS